MKLYIFLLSPKVTSPTKIISNVIYDEEFEIRRRKQLSVALDINFTHF